MSGSFRDLPFLSLIIFEHMNELFWKPLVQSILFLVSRIIQQFSDIIDWWVILHTSWNVSFMATRINRFIPSHLFASVRGRNQSGNSQKTFKKKSKLCFYSTCLNLIVLSIQHIGFLDIWVLWNCKVWSLSNFCKLFSGFLDLLFGQSHKTILSRGFLWNLEF